MPAGFLRPVTGAFALGHGLVPEGGRGPMDIAAGMIVIQHLHAGVPCQPREEVRRAIAQAHGMAAG